MDAAELVAVSALAVVALTSLALAAIFWKALGVISRITSQHVRAGARDDLSARQVLERILEKYERPSSVTDQIHAQERINETNQQTRIERDSIEAEKTPASQDGERWEEVAA